MKQQESRTLLWGLRTAVPGKVAPEIKPAYLRASLDIPDPSHPSFSASLPFLPGDGTVGCENEMQTAVGGSRSRVDLPRTIEESNYYANLREHLAEEGCSPHAVSGIERFLENNTDQVWENSWVRIPQRRLNAAAVGVLSEDLCDSDGKLRSDHGRFFVREGGDNYIRVPTSYLLKLALIQYTGSDKNLPHRIVDAAFGMTGIFTNDNSSPEILSAYVAPLGVAGRVGVDVAEENATRFLLSHLLMLYAEKAMGLGETGQKPMIYFSPHAPVRQAELADHVSDAFYRELYVNPCLSGFDDGEQKGRYMGVCHEVLSRSALHALKGLRDAEIITRNLIVLPQNSTASLANNGVHISLGSKRLTEARTTDISGFGAAEEKYHGDLVIKIVEHFLPLFVGTCSAAPRRLDFTDFHPERVLRYLPHQLVPRHLRMLWHGWKKKARIHFLQKSLTPVGPAWLDRTLASTLGLRGDFVPDMRLLDYLVALPGTDRSPGLNGRLDSEQRCKQDLADMGVFDARMSFYLPFKLRQQAVAGFSGFECRIYSQFAGPDDLADTVALQSLMTALASKYVLSGRYTHRDIPSTRFLESERRQIFFASAAGVKAVYIRKDSENRLLMDIVRATRRSRSSARYSGFIKVYLDDYREAALSLIERDAAELIEIMGLGDTVDGLRAKLADPRLSATGRLTQAVLERCNARSPVDVPAREFNLAAERHYREDHRSEQVSWAFDLLERAAEQLDRGRLEDDGLRAAVAALVGQQALPAFVRRTRPQVIAETITKTALEHLLGVTILVIQAAAEAARAGLEQNSRSVYAASVYRA